MDEVRRSEKKEQKSKDLHLSRRLLMVPETKQSAAQREKTNALCQKYPKTGRAYRMVQALDLVYASNSYEEAQERLKSLCSWLRRSRLEPMKRAGLTLQKNAKEILNVFVTKLTNAICEGINSMVQAAKRKARGYHTFEGFSSMIYLIASKLQLACPNPLRLWE